MTNLTRYENNGIELIINSQTGEAFATQAGYVRMSNKSQSTISERISKLNRSPVIGTAEIDTGYSFELNRSPVIGTAEIDTGYGIKKVQLIPAELVFEWLMKDNSELAILMGKAGATVYLYQLAGYKVSSNAVTQNNLPQTYLESLKALVVSEEAKEQLKLQNSILENQISDLEEDIQRQAEIVDELYDYSSIIRIAKFNQVNEKTFNWRKLKSTSEVLGLDILQAPCQRYVTKNLYHRDVWKVAYPEYLLPEINDLTRV